MAKRRRGRPRKTTRKRRVSRKRGRRRSTRRSNPQIKIVRVNTMAKRGRKRRSRRRGRPLGRKRRRRGGRRSGNFLRGFGIGNLLNTNTIVLAGAGAFGVLGIGFVMSKIIAQTNAPTWVKDGWGRVITEAGIAMFGGRLLRNFAPPHIANAVSAGALTWAALDAISMLRFGTLNPAVRLTGLGNDPAYELESEGGAFNDELSLELGAGEFVHSG